MLRVINETIKHYNNKNSGVYMCSLDAEKAFDSCNWDALFRKLVEEKNIPPQVVQVISSLYRNGTAHVHYENNISEEFNISQGVYVRDRYCHPICTTSTLNFFSLRSKKNRSLAPRSMVCSLGLSCMLTTSSCSAPQYLDCRHLQIIV